MLKKVLVSQISWVFSLLLLVYLYHASCLVPVKFLGLQILPVFLLDSGNFFPPVTFFGLLHFYHLSLEYDLRSCFLATSSTGLGSDISILCLPAATTTSLSPCEQTGSSSDPNPRGSLEECQSQRVLDINSRIRAPHLGRRIQYQMIGC